MDIYPMWQPILKEAIRLHKKGSYARAEKLYHKVLSIAPDHGDALHLLGLLFSTTRRTDEARHYLEKAASLFPDNPLFLYDLGVFHFHTGDCKQAETYLRKTIALQHEHFQALYYLGNVYRIKRDYQQAVYWYTQAVTYNPDYIPALCNLGTAYSEMALYDEATACFEKTLSYAPEQVEAYNNLGLIAAKTGDIKKALAYYQKAHQIHPQEPRIYSNILMYSHYLDTISNDEMFSLHRQYDKEYQHFYSDNPTLKKRGPATEKLRIGYVSADFRTHSVGYFIEPVIASHDKNTCEIICYSDIPVPDETTERIKEHASAWHSIYGIDDDTASSMIRDDRIDILVDCAGHTENNRLPLFMKKPAPIQITYLGYPDTTGLATMDYRLTDALTDPDGSDTCYTEKLIRLKHSFLCYRPPDRMPPVQDAPYLAHGSITFGSCNNLPKINEAVITLWSAILNALPGAKLLLKSQPLENAAVRKKYTTLFNQHGIAAEQLILRGHNFSTEEHLNTYNAIDIALDPFPYNGTTTTFEALLMGVPVITLAGDRHAGRVGVSILTNLGMTDCIARSPEHYIEIARHKANNLSGSSEYRQNLRELLLKSVLCDGKEFTKNLEKIYRQLCNSTGNTPA